MRCLLKMERKPQPKKIFLELEKKDDFKCIQEEKGCFYLNGDGKRHRCTMSPCSLNLFNFGTHERIIEFYLDQEEWDEAYFYFQDLLPKFSIDCDVKTLEELRKNKEDLETKDLPPGCRVFKISEELWGIKSNLKIYKDKTNLSEKGYSTYESEKTKFKNKLHSNLEILKHLALDKRQHLQDELRDKYYKLLLVKTQMGELKPEALELPLHKDVEDAIKDKKNDNKKKKDKLPGF